MKKQTRKEKKAEEARILAEMKAALEEAERAENAGNAENEKMEGEKTGACTPARSGNVSQEPTYHCRRCKTVMQKGVCPTCGFKMYVPMDEKKLSKIKLVLTAVGMAIFVAIFIYLQIKKS